MTTTDKTASGTSTTRRIVEETTVRAPQVPTKAYRLKPNARHFQDGSVVKTGDVVHLNSDQARAFRDRFEPVDDSDFKVQEGLHGHSPDLVKQGEEQRKTQEGTEAAKGGTDIGSTGAPVGQPAIPVPNAPPGVNPHDVTSTDPSRQGQQSREQRQIIDSGQAPMATPQKDMPKPGVSTIATGTGGAAQAGAPRGPAPAVAQTKVTGAAPAAAPAAPAVGSTAPTTAAPPGHPDAEKK